MKPKPFGKYYLLERINVGGMAEVFKAKQFGSDGFERIVAIKRILPNIAEDEEFITMFVDEAKIAVKLNHPNIAQIYELDKVDGIYYIAMEYIHGKDLRTIFERLRAEGKTMDIGMACYIIMKVCEGLDYAHNKKDEMGREMGIVHRDISPQNILISYEGDVKIIDFGIAKAAGKASKTQAGILKGKFGYMSPEQVRGLPLDRRSDIFSLGIVLYELLTGERLFVGESDFSTLEKVRNVEILPPTTYNRNIPDELERIVLKALEKEPENRYQTAAEMHEELQAFMYTSGLFFSRKDLAAWMKMTFARELLEEQKKLEEYQKLKPPPEILSYNSGGHVPAPKKEERRGIVIGSGDLDWEDEELETQLYDKPPPAPAPSWHDDVDVLESADVVEEEEEPVYAPVQKERPAPKRTMMGMPGPGEMPREKVEPQEPEWGPAQPQPAQPQQREPEQQWGPAPAAPVATAQQSSHHWMVVGTVVLLLIAAVGAVWFLIMVKKGHARGVIEIRPEPAVGSKVVIGDEEFPVESPHGIRIEKAPGTYSVKVVHAGYVTEKKVLQLRAGKEVLWEPVLKPDKGYITVVGLPDGAEVRIKGQKEVVKKAPVTQLALPAGQYTVEVLQGDDFYPLVQKVKVESGKTTTINYSLYPKKVAVTVPADPSSAKVCVTTSPSGPLTPDECRYRANETFEFFPEEGKKYYVVVTKKGYGEVRIPMELKGKKIWTPTQGMVRLQKAPPGPVPSPRMAVVSSSPSTKAYSSVPPPTTPAPSSGSPVVTPPSVTPPTTPPPSPMRVVVRVPRKPRPPRVMRASRASSSGGGKPGKVLFIARPRASIYVDGAFKGMTPRKVTLSPGRHKVKLINNERGLKKIFYINVSPGQEFTKRVRLE